MFKTVLSLAISISSFTAIAQVVHIPDANFKSYLLNQTDINTNGDNEIQLSEAENYTGTIDCSVMDIAYLTGIEAFSAITSLNCFGNKLTFLNLSQHTTLENLNCGYNSLTSLDLTNNTALTSLECYLNQLTSLNLSQNAALEVLVCGNNKLSSLDLSNNSGLVFVSCPANQFMQLDFINNTRLTEIYCFENQLTSLNLSQNIALEALNCSSTQISSLDLSQNIALEVLLCTDNPISILNIANGHNTNLKYLRAYNNPNLNCIQVDDSEFSNMHWTNGNIEENDPYVYDANVIFNETCTTGTLPITNDHYITVYPNPSSGFLYFSKLSNVHITNAFGQVIETKKNINFLDIASHPHGVYFISILDDNGVIIQQLKFIKF